MSAAAAPVSRRARARTQRAIRGPKAEKIADALEGIWLMLDRAALWVSSIHADLVANSSGLVDQTCAALLPTIPRRMYTLTCPGARQPGSAADGKEEGCF